MSLLMASVSGYSAKVYGYCSLTPAELAAVADSKGPAALANLPGEYVVVLEGASDTYLISSPYGICQYHYAIVDGRLYHGETVLEVLQRARLGWTWNWQALGDLILLENLHDDDSLHPAIRRVPPGTILRFSQDGVDTTRLAWEQLHPPGPSTPLDALDALNAETSRWMTPDSVIALSGGLDSRLILSSLLAGGCRPSVVTMGFAHSPDVLVSRMICDQLELRFTRAELSLADYLENGSHIAALTNGAENADHWHAYIFPKRAGLQPDRPLFVGTNGEFARSPGFSIFGPLSVAANVVSPYPLYLFWQLRMNTKRLFRAQELSGLRPELAAELSERNRRLRISQLVARCYRNVFPGYDRYYLEQRTRTMVSHGLVLIGAHASWRAPMFSRDWCRHIFNLERSWKLGSNWHRFAIDRNWSQLLDFPEEGGGHAVSRRAPASYWIPQVWKKLPAIRRAFGASGYVSVSYASYDDWFRDDRVRDFILDNNALLEELVDRGTVASIVEENRTDGRRTRTVAFLMAMVFWLRHLKEAERLRAEGRPETGTDAPHAI